MYYVYILKSKKDNNLYIGYTSSVEERLKYHNSGRVRSTKVRRPFELMFQEAYSSETTARQRESFLKSGQGRKWIKEKLFNMVGWLSG